MEAHRLDRLITTFGRRLSRRAAVRVGATGLAAGALAAAGRSRPAIAQEATPVASPAAATDLEYLFVQVFERGTFRPKAGEPGVYVLAFSHSSAQTLYFSNRPERIVGTVPTARFLPTTVVDPPNAALVTRAADGAEDVLVVELLSPTYDEAAGTLSYDVRVLENYQAEGLRYLADQQGDSTVPEQFGQASLFIDDCPDGDIPCFDSGCANYGSLGTHTMCGNGLCCGPCQNQDVNYWIGQCNEAFTNCGGDCHPEIADTIFACFGSCGGHVG